MDDFVEQEKSLSACETVIMKAIWDASEDIAIQDLINVLKEKYGKDYARTTVVTFLLKLSDKGYAKTYRKGLYSYAHAIKTEEEYKQKMVQEEVDFWFQGNAANLMSALCKGRKLTKEEAKQIRSILDEFAR